MDAWGGAAEYEAFIGRWSRPVAAQFAAWLHVEPGARWLDVGCGTGALTQALRAAGAAEVVALDRAPGFVLEVAPAGPALLATGAALPFRDATFDGVGSGLVLNFLPDPPAALAEMVRVTRPGGSVAGYVWDYAGGMELLAAFWQAVVDEDPAAAALSEDRRFPLCAPDALARLWTDAGLRDVEGRALGPEMAFPSFDACWRPFLGGQGPGPTYLATLEPAQRERVRARLEALLPAEPDGTLSLQARAWAVKGQVPG